MTRQTGSAVAFTQGILVAMTLAAAPRPAMAQTPAQPEVSAGYMTVNGSMHGWNAQASAHMTRRLSVFGQVDAARGPDPGYPDPIYHDWAALGGVRFGWQPTPRISPFGQVLVGMLNTTSNSQMWKSSYTHQTGVLQPGGGVTVMVSPRVGIRGQYQLQIGNPEVIGLMHRFALGAVIRLGR